MMLFHFLARNMKPQNVGKHTFMMQGCPTFELITTVDVDGTSINLRSTPVNILQAL